MLLGGFLVGSPRLPHATAFRDFRYGHILLRVVGRHCQMRCAEGFLLTRSRTELPLPQIRPRVILPRNIRRTSGLVQTPPVRKSDPRTNKGMLRAQANSWRDSRTSKNRADLSAGVGRARRGGRDRYALLVSSSFKIRSWCHLGWNRFRNPGHSRPALREESSPPTAHFRGFAE